MNTYEPNTDDWQEIADAWKLHGNIAFTYKLDRTPTEIVVSGEAVDLSEQPDDRYDEQLIISVLGRGAMLLPYDINQATAEVFSDGLGFNKAEAQQAEQLFRAIGERL